MHLYNQPDSTQFSHPIQILDARLSNFVSRFYISKLIFSPIPDLYTQKLPIPTLQTPHSYPPTPQTITRKITTLDALARLADNLLDVYTGTQVDHAFETTHQIGPNTTNETHE